MRFSKITKIPVIGWIISMCLNLHRLPRIMADVEAKLSNKLEDNEQNLKIKLQENEQNYAYKLGSIHSVIELSRADILAEQKRHIDNVSALLKESLVRDLAIMNIKQHNLKPIIGYETMQSNLVSLINNKKEEFDSYSILPIETLYTLVEDNTAVVGNYAYVFNRYANTNNLLKVKACKPNIKTLLEDLTGVDNIIICNTNLSTLILLSQELLFEIGQKIKGKLHLTVRTSKNPICMTWEGFSDSEKNDETNFRWAEGDSKKAIIKLYNTLSSVEAEINCTSFALCGHGSLYIRGSFGEQCYDLSNQVNINLKLILQPGENIISFDFHGDIVIPEGDGRKLTFIISNFICKVYGNENIQTILDCTYPIYLNDDNIRKTLHKSGFFEVRAKVYRNHGFYAKDLPVSKYVYPSGYQIQSELSDYCGFDEGITLYTAYRLEKERDDYDA